MKLRTIQREELKMMITLMVRSSEDVEELHQHLIDEYKAWQLTALNNLFDDANIQSDKKLNIFIYSITDGVIGKMISIGSLIVKWAVDRKLTKVDLPLVCNKIFTQGKVPNV